MLILGVLTTVSYLPAMLWGGIVWDDTIITNALPLQELTGLWSIWFQPSDLRQWEGHYWPMVYTTFWLEHRLWGTSPTGYHIVNVLLHFANTLLLWHLLQRLAVPGAWLIAAVFAAHPVHVESVAWIIERKDVLSGLFYLTAFLAWMKFAEKPTPVRWFVTLALFSLGMLSKSIVVTLPAALLIWHWWKQGRITVANLLALAPFFVVGWMFAAADVAFYGKNEVVSFDYTALERVLIAARALWFYTGKLLLPIDLMGVYPLWEVNSLDPIAWGYLLAAVGLAVALWLLRHRIGRGALACALFFAVTLAPVLNFVDYGYMQFSLVADRHQYLAGIGVLVALISYAVVAVRNLPRTQAAGAVRAAGAVAAAGVLAVFTALSWQHAELYRSDLTLFTHIAGYNPAARDIHYNLGIALAENERFAEAEESFQRALGYTPRHERALRNLGIAQLRQHRHKEALATYRRLLAIAPRDSAGLANLAIALHYLGKTDEAMPYLDRALILDPELHTAKNNREQMPKLRAHTDTGIVLAEEGRLDEAEKFLRGVVEIEPRYTVALRPLAHLQRRQGRHDEALVLYRKIAELDPDEAIAQADLGMALLELGHNEEALASLEQALALDPNLEEAQANLDIARRKVQEGQ